MARKEARYGKYKYFRTKVPRPDGSGYEQVYGKTKTERDEKVAALQAQWAAEAAARESPFVWQYAAQWYAREAPGMSEARRAAVSREINRVICPAIGHLRLREVTSDDIKAVMATRASYAKATQEKTRQILRRIFADAEEAGKISRDPARRIKAGGRGTQKKEALTEQQQQTLLAAVEGLPVWLFCMLGLYAGLRREEICGLQWDCVELDAKAPHLKVRRACRWIRNSQPEISQLLKSDAAWRDIPLPVPLQEALRAEKGKCPPDEQKALSGRCVLTDGQGEPWSYATLRSAWDSVKARSTGTVTRRRKDPVTGETKDVEEVKHLGDPVFRHPGVTVSIDFPVSPHILRHTYITRLILGRVDLKRVQYLAGHSSAKITLDIYTSLMGHQPEDLADDVAGIFNPELTPELQN